MPDDPGEIRHADPAATTSLPATGGWLIAGRYRVCGRLGSGAMADVYRAHDETLDRDVAVKVFRAVMDDGDTAGTARRELELQALARLSHPNLITLFDGNVDDEQGPAFLALELVDGPTLAATLQQGALPEPQARQLGAQIADALAYVHERGMVHRDVKPANILLGRDGAPDPSAMRARLSDFGIVRLVDSAHVTAADLTIGTAYYLAPEQARSAAVGPAADVYSLGLVLLEAITGARAFDGPMHEVLVARLTRDPEIPANLPGPWTGLLRAMTAADPALRPSAAAVAQTLRAEPVSGPIPIFGDAAAAGVGAGAAGVGAAAVGAAALADDRGPLAAAAARTTAVPRTGIPPTASPPASFGRRPGSRPGAEGEPDVEPARHHMTGMLVAAAVFLAIIAGAGWFFFHPAAHSMPPQQGQVGSSSAPQPGSSGSSSARHSGRRSGSANGPVPVNKTLPRHPGRHHASASSRPAPSTSAPVRSSQPPTSAPPTRPTTSAPPNTSNPPSTSNPPTSNPPTSASSAPTSAASSPNSPPPTAQPSHSSASVAAAVG